MLIYKQIMYVLYKKCIYHVIICMMYGYCVFIGTILYQLYNKISRNSYQSAKLYCTSQMIRTVLFIPIPDFFLLNNIKCGINKLFTPHFTKNWGLTVMCIYTIVTLKER